MRALGIEEVEGEGGAGYPPERPCAGTNCGPRAVAKSPPCDMPGCYRRPVGFVASPQKKAPAHAPQPRRNVERQDWFGFVTVCVVLGLVIGWIIAQILGA